MSAQHGGTSDTAVVESFKEALRQRIGDDSFRMWFTHGITVAFRVAGGKCGDKADGKATPNAGGDSSDVPGMLVIAVVGKFALERLQNKFIREIRAAAYASCGPRTDVTLKLDARKPVQIDLPLTTSVATGAAADSDQPPTADGQPIVSVGLRNGTPRAPRHPKHAADGESTTSARQLMLLDVGRESDRNGNRGFPGTGQPVDREMITTSGSSNSGSSTSGSSTAATEMTASNFIAGPCNQLAYTAMTMSIHNPSAASPLFLFGPSGTGKTHLLSAVAEQFRRRHRMRRVVHLSAEQFTNDFISSVGNSGIASFRRRYRDVDALLIDDVQFLGEKRATLREMLYTVETLIGANRPLIFSANQAPTEIAGLTRELAGRMASGLMCPLQPLDQSTRETLLRRVLQQRCGSEIPESMVAVLNSMLAGDGRVISGLANLVNTLQRMLRRLPTVDEVKQYGGDLLRAAKPVTNLNSIERAVCETFQLPESCLRDTSQSRSLSEPRMLAMYLSRELTSAAYAEIGAHYGGRSHSTAIAAGKNIQKWLQSGKSIGRGHAAMTVQEAIDRIEGRLRSG